MKRAPIARKYAMLACALVAAVFIALPAFGIAHALGIPGLKGISETVYAAVLAKGSDQRGYLGSYTTITIAIGYDGATARVSVTTKNTAYIALGAAIFGLYDDIIHKFRAFGAGSRAVVKDGCTLFNWVCYDFKILGKHGQLTKHVSWGKWLRISYTAYAYIEVKKYPHWLAPPQVWDVRLTANPQVLVPPDAYSKSRLATIVSP